MRGYLSVAEADSGSIPLDSRVGIYRDGSGSHSVCASTAQGEHELGVSDVTVSREKNGTPAVVIEPRQSHIEIRNEQNANGVLVAGDGDRVELDKGRTTRIEDTATVRVGFHTKLRLTVEREAKTEINVGGNVGGDVVAGDDKSVDERTQVVDSVVNRSEIGADGGAEIEDSVVNGSTVGPESTAESHSDSDTQNYCEVHERMYTAETCPMCQAERSSANDESEETKFCMFCGTKIPAVAKVCPDCGKQLPNDA